jgi:murein L,D-transpeptidase YcbB/YkuD
MDRRALAWLGLALLLTAGIAGAGYTYERQFHAPAGDPPLRLVLNVPAHRLYVYEHGQQTRVYRVSVGMPGYQTPAGSYAINSVIWNPWWHPPKSDWARDRKPEPPGPSNPMGRVKLNFAPLLYVHGTEERMALGDPASHGCVRLINEDLIELTRLVHEHTTPGLAPAQLAELEANPTLTRTIRLPQAVPFEVVYSVAAVRGDFLLLYPDVYQRVDDYKRKVAEALARDGIDPEQADWSKLEPLIEHAQRTKVAIALDELLAPAAAPPALDGAELK